MIGNDMLMAIIVQDDLNRLQKLIRKNPAHLNKTIDKVSIKVDEQDLLYIVTHEMKQDGNTPLMVASSRQNMLMIRYLVERGANINLQNKVG